MTKSRKAIIAFLVLLLITYVAIYLYKQLDILTSFDDPINLQKRKEINPETSLNIIVREKDFLFKYKNDEEIVTKTEEILAKYYKLSDSNPELTVTFEPDEDLELLRIMISLSDISVIPAGKMKIINNK